ncbi:MAG: GrpB family protein [Betaproteobacteria bacterium]
MNHEAKRETAESAEPADPAESVTREVTVVPYDQAWPRLFREEADRLRAVFGHQLIHVHHIGSTALPGLAAKPIIDILPVVRDIEMVDRFNAAMARLGYEPMGENGIPGRRYFERCLRCDGAKHHTHHVHVFSAGDPAIERHLAFRDYLRARPDVACQYAELKKDLARLFRYDVHGYTSGKNAFVKATEAAALTWWRRVPVVVLSGAVGVGKTAVANEVSDLLSCAGVPHAFVDFDALTQCYPRSPGDAFGDAVGLANLAHVWRNARSCGARCLVVARVVESREELDGVRDAVPGADIAVVRLAASPSVLAERVRMRERGHGLQWHLGRAIQLAQALEQAAVEDHLVQSDGRTVREVAREVIDLVLRPMLPEDLAAALA